MERQQPKAPDLENGFLVLGAESENAWATEILCAVKERSANGERWHYLSKECRSEDVPFMNDENSTTIFQAAKSMEFMMAVYDGRPIQISTHDITVFADTAGEEEWKESVPIRPSTMADSFTAEVHCTQRDVRTVPVLEVLERLRDRCLPIRNLFMRIAWTHAGGGCEVFCPCRYVNFSNLANGANDYVQPISGYGMILHPDVGLQIGYWACALAADGRRVIEFCGKRYRNVFSWAVELVEAQGGSSNLTQTLAKSFPISATVFDSITPIEGACELYEYCAPVGDDDRTA